MRRMCIFSRGSVFFRANDGQIMMKVIRCSVVAVALTTLCFAHSAISDEVERVCTQDDLRGIQDIIFPFEPGEAQSAFASAVGCIPVEKVFRVPMGGDVVDFFQVPVDGDMEKGVISVFQTTSGESIPLVESTEYRQADLWVDGNVVVDLRNDYISKRVAHIIGGMVAGITTSSVDEKYVEFRPNFLAKTPSIHLDDFAVFQTAAVGSDMVGVTFISDPIGAELMVDGVGYGSTVRFLGISARRLATVRFRHPGYQDCVPGPRMVVSGAEGVALTVYCKLLSNGG
jgi:hypothetical protein